MHFTVTVENMGGKAQTRATQSEGGAASCRFRDNVSFIEIWIPRVWGGGLGIVISIVITQPAMVISIFARDPLH
jgi:hypothetical protein